MRKLDMASYMVTVKGPDHMNPGKTIKGEMPYDFKESVLNLLFNPELHLTGAELVRQNMLAMKLESCEEDVIILENEEFDRIKRAIDVFKGFQRNDTELVMRITEAAKVEVQTK